MAILQGPESDPTLGPFRGGVAALRRGGELAGHIASEVSSPSRPLSRHSWAWFVIVWTDGVKDRLIEDYPPWTYVTEMKQGYVDLVRATHEGTYEIDWIPADIPGYRDELEWILTQGPGT